MHNPISNLLTRYEQGQLTRRDLICGLAALAVVSPASAQSSSTFRGAEMNHVALFVTDVQRSRDFYQKHFGLPVVDESPGMCFLGLGQNFLALFENPNPRMYHYCIGIEDFEVGRVKEELTRQDLNPHHVVGTNRIYFDDPDGLEVQVSSVGHQP